MEKVRARTRAKEKEKILGARVGGSSRKSAIDAVALSTSPGIAVT